MDKPIEYTGTISEWKRCYFGDISNKVKKVCKPTRMPVTMYKLLYRNEIVVQNKPYAICRALMNQKLKTNNYNSIHFKITKQ